uniref:Four helix bundle protein n=1 Tax=Panagrellus redivivus TaxID=6233 RepID=A0A7E4UPU2_PANRE
MERAIQNKREQVREVGQNYAALYDETEEYMRVADICMAYLKDKKSRVMVNVADGVFTRASVASDAHVCIRLIDNLFAEMPMEQAITYCLKRIALLEERMKHQRRESQILQFQLNKLMLGAAKMARRKRNN